MPGEGRIEKIRGRRSKWIRVRGQASHLTALYTDYLPRKCHAQSAESCLNAEAWRASRLKLCRTDS